MRFETGLEGLRGLAIVLVVAFHTQLLPGGWVGVDVFFVLSGFLITRLLMADLSLPLFYVRRLRRLLPALVLMLAGVALVVAPWKGDHVSTETLVRSAGYTANLTDTGPVLGHTWSLAQEEQFYLLWPLLLVGLLPRGRRVALSVAGLLGFACLLNLVTLTLSEASFERVYFGPDVHALPMLVGCGLALTGWEPGRKTAAWVGGGGLLVLAAILPFRPETAPGYLPLAIGAAICGLCLVVASRAFPEAFGWPLRRLGLYSYGIYLWHYPLIYWFPDALAVPMALGCAVASYHIVEAPIRRVALRKRRAVAVSA